MTRANPQYSLSLIAYGLYIKSIKVLPAVVIAIVSYVRWTFNSNGQSINSSNTTYKTAIGINGKFGTYFFQFFESILISVFKPLDQIYPWEVECLVDPVYESMKV